MDQPQRQLQQIPKQKLFVRNHMYVYEKTKLLKMRSKIYFITFFSDFLCFHTFLVRD